MKCMILIVKSVLQNTRASLVFKFFKFFLGSLILESHKSVDLQSNLLENPQVQLYFKGGNNWENNDLT